MKILKENTLACFSIVLNSKTKAHRRYPREIFSTGLERVNNREIDEIQDETLRVARRNTIDPTLRPTGRAVTRAADRAVRVVLLVVRGRLTVIFKWP